MAATGAISACTTGAGGNSAHLPAEAPDEEGEVQQLRHPGAPHLALGGELCRRAQELLHVERRRDLDPSPRRAVTAVGEPVHAPGGHDDDVARGRDDRAQAETERHRAGEHVEALLLLGVHVGPGNAAVGGELELELEQLATGVGGGAQELDPLTADGVRDGLPGVCHGRSSGGRRTRRRGGMTVRPRVGADVRSVVGRDDDRGSPAAAISRSHARPMDRRRLPRKEEQRGAYSEAVPATTRPDS